MNGGTLILVGVIAALVCELFSRRTVEREVPPWTYLYMSLHTSTSSNDALWGVQPPVDTSDAWWPASSPTTFYIDRLYIEGGKPLPYIDWTNPE